MSAVTTMSATFGPTVRNARAAVRADRGGVAGTFIVLMLAAALISATGVVMESGIRAQVDGAGDAALLATLAGSFAGTALGVVVLVVASTFALAIRRRRREFALMRAIGATRKQVRRMVGAEVLLVTVVAAPLGAVPGLFAARLLTPTLVDSGIVSAGFQLTLSPIPALAAVALLLPVALLAARLAARETLRMAPTAAVREATIEKPGIGRARLITAAVLAGTGLSSAFSSVAVPGTIGAAVAATSAFLLVGAAALAGPLLVTRLLGHSSSLISRTGGVSTAMALANTRGFARRLTTAIVPLALALSAGTVQTSVDKTVSEAATRQLDAGIHAELVATPAGSGGITAAQVDRIADLPGVRSATALSTVGTQVRTDDEMPSALSGLAWEPFQLRVLPDGGAGDALDPDVTAGSLADLDGEDTVAISADAKFDLGKGIGDHVTMRFPDDTETQALIVAVYDRGLGFGDYLVGVSTVAAHDPDAAVDTVLLSTDPGASTEVAGEVKDLGVTAQSKDAYVDSVQTAAASSQHLSAVLLLALLAFVGLAAANTLVMTTAGRRAELDLLRRTGATRAQLLRMAWVESLITGAAAWAIGTVAVIPAVLGVGFGLLGASMPGVGWTAYAVLSVLVLAISVLTIVPTVVRNLRGPVSAR
ncbi:ABC transporter permease [Nocardioides sp.]|uniref:FtsX-like permease family protein n=1 Tax=Nocardioides sp. TaxID=35761 RepID=UPI0025F3008A|nr:ABC transporter permease [Nocardioides sp.]